MLFTHKYFRRGYITDGDSTDVEGNALRKMNNLDVYVGVGVTRVRPAIDDYTGLGTLPDAGSVVISATTYYYQLYDVVRWNSGIDTLQYNTMLIYRAGTSASWRFKIYSNAPEGGDSNAFTLLESDIDAPSCFALADSGEVRVALGNANNYRIHLNLAAAGTRSYCSSGLTISSADTDVSRDLGNDPTGGGKWTKGWLWDWGKLYEPWTHSHITAQVTAATSTTNPLDPADYAVMVVPVYDNNPEQIGPPIDATFIDKSSVDGTKVIEIDFTVDANYNFNKRIYGFAVYVKRTNHETGDMAGYSRLMTVDIADLPASGASASPLFTIDAETFMNHEGAWASDTDGRPAKQSPFAPSDAESEISVQCEGFAARKELLYAWGCDNDSSQSKIRQSSWGSARGMKDVFYIQNVIWKAGISQKTNYLLEWDDRMIEMHDNHIYHLELGDRPRFRDSYMYDDDSASVGVPQAFVRTVTKGKRSVFFANHQGIWAFRNNRTVNILKNRWLKEWLDLTVAQRESSIGGYNFKRGEYWIAYQVPAGSDLPDQWRFFLFADDDIEYHYWRTYSFANFAVSGFFNTKDAEFVMYGTNTSTGGQDPDEKMYLFDDPNQSIDFGSTAISYELESQNQGRRYRSLLLHTVDVEANVDSGHDMTMLIYTNNRDTNSKSLKFNGDRLRMKRIKPMRCKEFRFHLSGSYTGGTLPEILEISFLAEADVRRPS